jgi:putative ABC transport system permease protein
MNYQEPAHTRDQRTIMSTSLQASPQASPQAIAVRAPLVTMRSVTLKGLARNKSRFLLTGLAVMLSVAFVTSVVLLTISLRGTATQDIETTHRNIDVVVRGVELGKAENRGPIAFSMRAAVPTSAVDAIASTPGVNQAVGVYSVDATLLTNSGELIDIGTFGTKAQNWIDGPLGTHQLVEGVAPTTDQQIVVEQRAAEEGSLKLGDSVRVVLNGTSRTMIVSGVVKFGQAGASPIHGTAFVANEFAAELLNAPGYDVVRIDGDGDQGALAAQISQTLGTAGANRTEAVTGASFIKSTQDTVNTRTGFQSTFLTFFALVSLLAGSTIIFNTFVIAVQQRTRELGMLRAIGVSKRQVLKSVLTEAVVIGAVASFFGVIVGMLLNRLMIRLFEAIGLSFVTSDAAVPPPALVGPFMIGIIVTTLSAALPARRAARVLPLEALRDAAVDTSASSKARKIISYVLLVVSVMLSAGAIATGQGAVGVQAAMLCVITAIVAGPMLVRASSQVTGAVISRLAGQPGKIAQRNLLRNPRRAASTSFSLLLGVALVVLFSTVAASLAGSSADNIRDGLRANRVIAPVNSGPQLPLPVSDTILDNAKSIDGVTTVSPIRTFDGAVDGTISLLGTLDPASIDKVYDLDIEGDPIAELGDGEVAVASSTDKKIGEKVTLSFANQSDQTFTIVSVFDRMLPGAPQAPQYMVSESVALKGLGKLPLATYAYLITDESTTSQASLQSITDEAGYLTLQDRDGYIESAAGAADDFRNFVYSLLSIAVLISLVGISNTTILAINERRREIGVMRAIGTTAKQVRRIIRLEALMMSIHGTVLGVLIGMVGAVALFGLLAADDGFTLRFPWMTILIVGIGGACAGVLASAWPAWKASKDEVLHAIASE